jgi:hypothetical protein
MLTLGRLLKGQNIDVNIGWAAWEACSVTRNFGTNSAFAPRKNHGKSWSSWPVAGPSGCVLTSANSPVLKHAISNCSPYLCYCITTYLLKKYTDWLTVSYCINTGLSLGWETNIVVRCLSYYMISQYDATYPLPSSLPLVVFPFGPA